MFHRYCVSESLPLLMSYGRDLEAQRRRRRPLPDFGYGPGRIGPPDSLGQAARVYGRPILSTIARATRYGIPVAASTGYTMYDYFRSKKKIKLDGESMGVSSPLPISGARRIKERHKRGGLTRGHLPKLRNMLYTPKRRGPKRYGRTSKRRRVTRKKKRSNKTSTNFAYKVQQALTQPQYFNYTASIHFDGELSAGQCLMTVSSNGTDFMATQVTQGPFYGVRGAGVASAIRTGLGGDTTTDYHVTNYQHQYRLKNNADECVFFRKWILTPRKDIVQASAGTTVPGLGQNRGEFLRNVLDADGFYNTVSSKWQNIKGMMWTPFQSTTLCSHFNVKGGKTFCVKAGEDWIYSYTYKKTWTFSHTRANNRIFFKGEKLLLLQCFGDIAHQTGVGANIGFSRPYIDGVCEWSCNAYSTHSAKKAYTTSSVLSTTNLETMQDEDMKIEAV